MPDQETSQELDEIYRERVESPEALFALMYDELKRVSRA